MLQLVQQATTELGLTVPTAVASSTSSDIVQILGLLNAVGYELQREYEWQAINKEYRFTTVFYQYTGDSTASSTSLTGMSSIVGLDSNFMVTGTGINQDTYVSSAVGATVTLDQAATVTATGTTFTFGQTKYSLPSDFDRQVDRTHFDKSKHWEMLGPETAQQWQFLKSAYISTGPRIRYRILGGKFQIWPLISTNDYLGFEYISNYWVTSTSSTTGPDKSSLTADTDTCIFPDRLMVLGLKKKYWEIKGFDTTAITNDYEKHLSIAKANDSGSPTLSFAPKPSSVLIGWENIPDSNYGQ
jgi:hypothetical protein